MTSLSQILHIVRKDVRHLLPEMSVSISLVALFAWIEPASWPGFFLKMPYPGLQFNAPVLIGVLLHGLIPMSWLVLISRLVHDESLVGDQQFWVTRPYTWYSLLTAKVVFIAGFLCFPFLLVQMFLVHYAGLSVTAHMAGLLANMGMLVLFFLLPFTVLASVTSSFGPLALVVLGGVIYLGVIGLFTTYLLIPSAIPPYAVAGWLVVMGLILAGILVHQYIRRKTGLSQIFLLAAPFVMAALVLIAPAGILFGRAYPGVSAVSGKVDLDVQRQQPAKGEPLLVNRSMVMALPLEISGMAEGETLNGKAMRLEMTSASGYRWTSPWQSFGNSMRNGPEEADLMIPAAVVQRIGNETIGVRLSLAVDRMTPDTPMAFQVSEADHAASGGGMCSLEEGVTMPVCRYALNIPQTIVETEVIPGMCPLDGSASTAPASSALSFLGGHENVFAFDPVIAMAVHVETGHEAPGPPILRSVCSGAQMKMTGGHEVGGEQIHIEQTGIELTTYLKHVYGPRNRVSGQVQRSE